MRRCLLFLVFVVLALQALASLLETGLYAGEKVYLDNNDLAYTKGWLYYFKWVVKPLSAALAIFLSFSTVCSCIFGGPDKQTRQGGRAFPITLGVVSVVMTALWAVICAYLMKDDDSTTVTAIINNSISAQYFVYPLGQGFSLKNDCSASPFTLIEHGSTACTLLKVESAVAFACLGLWAISILFSAFLVCAVRRGGRVAHEHKTISL
ncbi:hypothetical protein GGF44_003778 [Coemansia sp. RSA 1694]|nr:hypothetical protein IWW47_002579 [Coemansia sp. RSA 2052]KAJ2581061.1 hypothetical protein GGH95_002269 [Coemansia sp. RSA 1836]KAJ2632651.1 hypothetical protein GGF44_003778 [Coemansia sp. RSA 1694]